MNYLLIAFLVFGSMTLMGLSWVAFTFYKEHLSQHQQQLSQRLQFLFEDATQGYALVGKNMPFSTNASIDSVLQQMRWAHWIQHKLARAGLSYSPFQFISLSSAVFLLGFFCSITPDSSSLFSNYFCIYIDDDSLSFFRVENSSKASYS